MQVRVAEPQTRAVWLTQPEQKSSVLHEEHTRKLIALQQKTSTSPFSIVHRLSLARAYRDLGYPDLAVGDAYKALLLVDEVAEDGEYYDEALIAATLDYVSEQLASASIEDSANNASFPADMVINWVRTICLKKAYVTMYCSF